MSIEILKRKDVAQMFGVVPNTIRVWERQGIMKPCCHVNKRPFYHKDEVNRLLNKTGVNK